MCPRTGLVRRNGQLCAAHTGPRCETNQGDADQISFQSVPRRPKIRPNTLTIILKDFVALVRVSPWQPEAP